jgi:tetratricopeptide (TPR) repeat protein
VRAMNDTMLRLILRASAISFLGTHLATHARSAVPELIRQLQADHPLIQMTAADALGRIGDRRAIVPVSQLLNHRARVVRVAAVASMMNLGVEHGRGEMGRRFDEAKAESLVSLRNWPNVPAFRVNIGNIHLIDDDLEEAESEYKIAIQLDPVLADAWYYLGMTYSRMGKWKEALDAWAELQKLDPDYPGVESLINTARAQRKN